LIGGGGAGQTQSLRRGRLKPRHSKPAVDKWAYHIYHLCHVFITPQIVRPRMLSQGLERGTPKKIRAPIAFPRRWMHDINFKAFSIISNGARDHIAMVPLCAVLLRDQHAETDEPVFKTNETGIGWCGISSTENSTMRSHKLISAYLIWT
jgi:hypothetical protein